MYSWLWYEMHLHNFIFFFSWLRSWRIETLDTPWLRYIVVLSNLTRYFKKKDWKPKIKESSDPMTKVLCLAQRKKCVDAGHACCKLVQLHITVDIHSMLSSPLQKPLLRRCIKRCLLSAVFIPLPIFKSPNDRMYSCMMPIFKSPNDRMYSCMMHIFKSPSDRMYSCMTWTIRSTHTPESVKPSQLTITHAIGSKLSKA